VSATFSELETGAPVCHGLRERQREARDEAVLQAAYAIMEEKGYEAMTMDELADRAGISKRTLYHHFPSKEAIATLTVIGCIDTFRSMMSQIGAGLEPGRRLEAVIRWLIEQRLSAPAGPLAYLKAQPVLMSSIRANDEYQAAMSGYTDTLAQIIEEARRAGAESR
jgi:AcrR family transcriptional regulator